jgi:quercetin dioxygenase-like cupin family protein
MRQLRSALRGFGAVFAVVACASTSGGGDRAIALGIDDGELNWAACPDWFPAGCQIAVLHGDPSQSGADVFVRVPGGYELPRHRHTSAERMVLVAGELHLTWDGERRVELVSGSYAYGPPQRPHSGRCVGEEPCVAFITFDAPLDASAVSDASP